MKRPRSSPFRAAAALAVAAALCSGGGCGGGISGTSILAFGRIGAFGSIVVNGITFNIGAALITIEGDRAPASDLKLGMVVSVRGRFDPQTMVGTAERVVTHHLLEGPVDAVNVAGGTFSALSQLVITDAGTVFDGTTLATLNSGENVEVFGFPDADGSIRATRVEHKASIQEIDLTGTVSGLDTINRTFMIGALTVDFSSAAMESLPPGGLADGLLVEVESSVPPVNDVLVADGVELFDLGLSGDEGQEIEVEGFVSTLVSSTEFVLNSSQTVLVTAATRFEGGTAGDLAVNVRLEAEGSFDANGALVAEEVEFLP